MLSRQLFEAWAPETSPWSPWAKPVLFAQPELGINEPATPSVAYDTDWLAREREAALLVNLPGAESVWFAAQALARGWRPVPLFNGCPGPNAVVPTTAIVGALRCVSVDLSQARLAENAPPAFLIDSNRHGSRLKPAPLKFDNRWLVFAQDFPSANLLMRHGIHRALLVQADTYAVPEDLAHVLLRWQRAGIQIDAVRLDQRPPKPQPITVRQPRWFGQFWYRLLALLNLRPNSTGGFGSTVPMPSSSSHTGFS